MGGSSRVIASTSLGSKLTLGLPSTRPGELGIKVLGELIQCSGSQPPTLSPRRRKAGCKAATWDAVDRNILEFPNFPLFLLFKQRIVRVLHGGNENLCSANTSGAGDGAGLQGMWDHNSAGLGGTRRSLPTPEVAVMVLEEVFGHSCAPAIFGPRSTVILGPHLRKQLVIASTVRCKLRKRLVIDSRWSSRGRWGSHPPSRKRGRRCGLV